MTFAIVKTTGVEIYEADDDDFLEVADYAYDNHTGYKDVVSIIKIGGGEQE